MATDLLRDNDTIAAIATPCGPGGVGIVKVSGPLARTMFKKLFQPAKELANPKSHHLYYGWVKDPAGGQLVDEVLCTLMLAPHSYTREDVLEIQCHSGPALLSKILQLVLDHGARLAMPGEFTKRAFLNGRIDLAQAEAVLELTTSKGAVAAAAAAKQLSGAMSQKIAALKQCLMEALAALEVAIDYPEEEGEILSEAQVLHKLRNEALPAVRDLIGSYERSRIWRDGATVLIVGRPNVGKSSLLNALVCQDRAIVSPVPGTTRDVIEADITIEGMAVRVIDTAGIRQGPDPIEALGIEKVGRLAENASLALWIWDATDISSREEGAVLAEIEPLARKKAILTVLNKVDLVRREDMDQMLEAVKAKACAAAGIDDEVECIPISAKKGTGLSKLSNAMARKLLSSSQKEPPEILPTLRQKVCAERCEEALARAASNLKTSASPEITAIDIRDAVGFLDELTGENASEDLLEQIFSNFCLGK